MKNRIIKFRTWDKINKKWMSGENFPQVVACMNEWDCEIMQFTGLLDKNGKEIYSGDILQQKKTSGTRFIVGWNTDGWWQVENLSDDGLDSLWKWAQVTEIIGNIYENPELLS